MRHTPLRILAAAIVLLLSLAPSAQAEEVVFVYEQYPPYEFIEDGVLKGTDVDIIREVCKRNGITPVFREVPWARAMEEVRQGASDAIFSLFRNEEREAFLAFPEVGLSSEKNIIVSAAGGGLSVNSLEDLAGKTVGVVTDYSYGEGFDDADTFERDASGDNKTLLKKLQANRVDVIVINEIVFNSLARSLDVQNAFEVMGYVVADEPMYVGFSRKSPKDAEQLAALFTTTLRELEAEGFLQEVYARY